MSNRVQIVLSSPNDRDTSRTVRGHLQPTEDSCVNYDDPDSLKWASVEGHEAGSVTIARMCRQDVASQELQVKFLRTYIFETSNRLSGVFRFFFFHAHAYD